MILYLNKQRRNCRGENSTPLLAIPFQNKTFFAVAPTPFPLSGRKKCTIPEICPKCSLGSSDNIINEHRVTVLSPINSIQFQTSGILGFMQMENRFFFFTFLVSFQHADLIVTVCRKKMKPLTFIIRKIMNYYSKSRLVALICI